MPADVLMFQGTASHVGKSVMAAAFCRLLRRRGLRVAPFKAMNMSNNAWVTRDGKEMAMAQAVQAWAAGAEPSVEMNPVLLKTSSDRCSQVIVMGKPIGTYEARHLPGLREPLLQAIHESLHRMRESFDVIVAEGAGSPAEINLRATDLANMEVARAADAQVILVADIERGGVFAQIVGTLDLLDEPDRSRVKGFLINKFRGDPSLLDSGVRWLEERTGKPVLGVVPYFPDMDLPEEDALAERLTQQGAWHPAPQGARAGFINAPCVIASDPRERSNLIFKDEIATSAPAGPPRNDGRADVYEMVSRHLRVQIVCYPALANFTDFDPLHREPDLSIRYLTAAPEEGELPDLLILPGSKGTMADLQWLRGAGLDRYLRRCVEEGVQIVGICGGFQMMGQRLVDPSHVESSVSTLEGLSLLPTSTLFLGSKVTAQVRGVHPESGTALTGYEIHCGRLQGSRRARPLFRLIERAGQPVDEAEGCQSEDGKVWGTYLHGLFESDPFRNGFLNRLRVIAGLPERKITAWQDPLDRWADRVAQVVSVDRLLEVMGWILSA